MEKVRKMIMLTFLASCATMLFVGCENENVKINDFMSGEYETFYSGEEDVVKSRK